MQRLRLIVLSGCSFVVALSGLGLACAEANSPPDAKELRKLIVEAAAVPLTQEIARKLQADLEGEDLLSSFGDQPLTLALLTLDSSHPFCRDNGKYLTEQGLPHQFEYTVPDLDPSRIVKCLEPPDTASYIAKHFGKRFVEGLLGLDSKVLRFTSAIWEPYITGLEFDRFGAEIVGTVSFEAPGCWSGKMPFTARDSDQGWRVEEFRMPDTGWKVTLGESGNWVAERIADDLEGVALEQLDLRESGKAVFGGTNGPTSDVVAVRFGSDGTVQVTDSSSGGVAVQNPLEFISGRPVALAPLRGFEKIGDFLAAVEAISQANPEIPAIGIATATGVSSQGGKVRRQRSVHFLTSGDQVRIERNVMQGARFCIAKSDVLVSTGAEMPLAISRDRDHEDFTTAMAKNYGVYEFLINPQAEAPYNSLERILRATVASRATKIVIATEHHRGIELLRRELE